MNQQIRPDPANIDIVTAFFDIGRGGWASAGNPSHLQCAVGTYLQRFAYLASLENEMVIYTSDDLVPQIRQLRAGKDEKTRIIPTPYAEMFPGKREAIRSIQKDPAFQAKINPNEAHNPEYWSPDYVLLMGLKPVFVSHAVQNNLVSSPLVAWVDFGYCRSREALGGSTLWRYPFAVDKIHLFVSSLYPDDVSIEHLVFNNVALVSGAALVAGRDLWPEFTRLTLQADEELMKRTMVDDDQTLYVMASINRPELFERHTIPKNDWQPVLRLFNQGAR